MKKTIKGFFNDQIDTHRKLICAFDSTLSKAAIADIIREYLREEEFDAYDDMSPIHTEEDLNESVQRIMNGGLLDLDFDRYFIDDITLYS